MKFSPRPVNLDITRFLASGPRRSNIHAGMGSGKTVSTLNYLDGLYSLEGETRPTLVLGPKRVVQSTWPDEIAQWDHLSGLEISVAVGTAAERAAALRRDCAIHAINYDNVQWLVEHLDGRWPYGTVIADESTRLKSFRTRQGGKRARALGSVAHKHVERWHNLTGTPAPNGMIDLWGQQWYVDGGQRLGRSFSSFEDRWFAFRRRGSDAFDLERIVLPGSMEDITARMADCTLTITNALGVEAPVINKIYVDMPAAAREKYRELKRDMYTEIESKGVEAFNAAGLTMKCLQAANGAVYTDSSGAWVELHDAKLQALDSVISEAAGMPVLVAYQFKSDLARILRSFPQARELDDNPETIKDWNAGRIPVLVSHPQSAGHGLNLQHGSNILVFFGLWWDLEPHEQIIERIGPTRQKQSGYNRPVFVHYMLARGTVDQTVFDRLQAKSSTQQALQQMLKDKQ